MASHPLRQGLLLVGGAELEELLDDVVAEDVGHQAVGRGEDLAEHHRLLLRGRPLQLLLDESGKQFSISFNNRQYFSISFNDRQ